MSPTMKRRVRRAMDIDMLKRVWRNEKAASLRLAPRVPRLQANPAPHTLLSLPVFSTMFLHFPTYDSVSDYGSLSWCRIAQEETLDDFTDSGVDDLVVSFYVRPGF